ncbi:hypothetical protein ACHWQZ_G014649 [Mnemiopsis leidyi]
MGRGRGRPKYKGHSRHFTSREELEEERKKDEEKQRRRDERGYDSPSESEESEEESSEESEDESKDHKKKGVEGLIEVSNPNRARKGQVKTANVAAGETSQLTRRQKEELARQNYQRLQLECKTDQAQKDLARLAIIRKKREEEAAKNAAAPK